MVRAGDCRGVGAHHARLLLGEARTSADEKSLPGLPRERGGRTRFIRYGKTKLVRTGKDIKKRARLFTSTVI